MRYKMCLSVGVLLFWLTQAPRLAQSADRPPGYPENFGNHWVSSRPFPIMGLVQSPRALNVMTYRKAGLNTLLAWKNSEPLAAIAAKSQLPWMMHIRHSMTQTRDGKPLDWHKTINELTKTHPGNTGFLVFDECQRNNMENAAKVTAWLKQNFPDSLVYGNGLPPCKPGKMYGEKPPDGKYSYRQYLTDFVRIIKPDVLMVDIYPFYYWSTRRDFLHCLSTIRAVSQEHNIPYFLFVQAMEWTSDRHRPVSESDMRMEVFSALTFGFKGISYFTYDPAREGTSLVDGEGKPRDRFYEYTQRINTEIAPLGKWLKGLKSTHVRYVQGGNELPQGLTAYKSTESIAPQIRSIRIVNGDNNHSALLGLFQDRTGNDFFMLTNYMHGPGKTPKQTQIDLIVTFDPTIGKVYRYRRSQDQIEELSLTNHQLRFTLPGGTGDLFSFRRGKLPSRVNIRTPAGRLTSRVALD